eukprot:scaffold45381_cov37-Tisochrysis_lutea.AAC.2
MERRLLPKTSRKLVHCEHCQPLRRDTNVLVLQRLFELRGISSINLALALASVLYLGVNVVCAIIVSYHNKCYPCAEAATSNQIFHMLEFGATFMFAIVTTLSLIFSPERQFGSPLLLKTLVFVNVGNTFVAALLVFVNVEKFEMLAHEIEYANELTMAVAEFLLAAAVVGVQARSNERLLIGAVLVAMVIATAQLLLYNLPWAGERPAHYLEFSFGAVCASVTFCFCIDSMVLADRLKREIMLAPEELTVVIDKLSRRGVHDHGERNVEMDEYMPPGSFGNQMHCHSHTRHDYSSS